MSSENPPDNFLETSLGETASNQSIIAISNDYDLSAEQQNTSALIEELLGKTIADRYIDFCRLAAGAFTLRVARPIAAHALRELDSIIRSILKVPMEAVILESKEDLKKFEAVRSNLTELGFKPDSINNALKALRPRLAHKEEIRRILVRLGLAPDGDIAKAWMSVYDLSGKAHKRSFHHSLSVDDEFRKDHQQPFEIVIRGIMIALKSRYSALMLRVTELAAMEDKSNAVKNYLNEIPGALPLQWHFFANLKTPDWLPHLAKGQLLNAPITNLEGDNNGGRLRQWPAGDYLLRMAQSPDASARKLVIDAIRDVAFSKHPDVQLNGLQVLAALPANESAPLADIAVAWIGRDYGFYFQHIPCKNLIDKLADGGEKKAALQVARALLQIWDRDGQIANLYTQHMYEYHLMHFVKILTKTCSIDALRFLCDLLQQATVISGKDRYEIYASQPLTDNKMADSDVYHALIKAVRISAEILLQENTTSVKDIVELLVTYKAKIFQRFALHVLSKNPKIVPELAESYLTNQEFIEEAWCSYEYAELAIAWFPNLTPAKQQEILGVVDAVPGKYLSLWKTRFEEQRKVQPTPDDEQVFNMSSIRDTVWKWHKVLPADRQKALSEMVDTVGDPDAWRRKFFQMETSPWDETDFLNRPIAEIIEFLKSWHPTEEPKKETITALAQKLRLAVEQNPARYADDADQFFNLAPVYVRHLLEGIRNASRSNCEFITEKILKLIQHTFSKMHDAVDPLSITEGDDPNWIWACTAGAELLRTGLGRGASGISYQHAALIQSIILYLLEQAPQQPELEDFEERFQREPYFGAEATLRGSAVNLCVLLIFWSSKYPESPVADAPQNALANMPEIKTALEKELEDKTTTGCIPRAILGRYLNWVFHFGKDWVIGNIENIFSPTDENLRRAAWLAYLGHDGPNKELWPFMFKFYEDEIQRLASGERAQNNRYDERLADYLIILYIWGGLPDKTLEQFWEVSPVELRRHAMWFLGSQLELTPEQLPDEFRARGLLYWERRLAIAKSIGMPDLFRAELGCIGHWCLRDPIDDQWLSDQLLNMLKAGFAPDDVFSVIGWLVKFVTQNVDHTVEILHMLLNYSRSNLTNGTLQEEAIRMILLEGMNKGTAKTKSQAQEIISLLSTVGATKYLDLLDLQKPIPETPDA